MTDEFFRKITPDYTKKISIPNNSHIPDNGVIIIMTSYNQKQISSFYINNVLVAYLNYEFAAVSETVLIPVKKGDFFNYSISAGSFLEIIFVPYSI